MISDVWAQSTSIGKGHRAAVWPFQRHPAIVADDPATLARLIGQVGAA